MTYTNTLCLLCCVTLVNSDQLLRLILVVSNGETTPPLALDSNTWNEGGLNQLTKEGVIQSFYAGLYIHDMYTDPNSTSYLFDTVYHKQQMEIQSSPKDCNLMSIESFLTGLFYTTDENKTLVDSILLRPVPIYESEYLDITDCIGKKDLVTKEEMATWDIVSFWGQNQDKINDLYDKIGYKGLGVNMLEHIYQLMRYEEMEGLTHDKTLDKYSSVISKAHELIWESKLYWSLDSIRALAGKAMSELTQKIGECVTGECSTDKLVLIYSSNVETLAWVQNALGFFAGAAPDPSTLLHFEVWRTEEEEEGGNYTSGSNQTVYVKVKQSYNNQTVDVSIYNCSGSCPVEDFLARSEQYSATEEELVRLCATDSYLMMLLSERTWTVFASSGCVLLLMGVILYMRKGHSTQISLQSEKNRWTKLLDEDEGY